jgi:hypothetical protein
VIIVITVIVLTVTVLTVTVLTVTAFTVTALTVIVLIVIVLIVRGTHCAHCHRVREWFQCVQVETMADNVQTALARVQELRQEIEATKTVCESVKRRRVGIDTEQPTEPTSLEHIDIDNVTKREARGAFPRWKCWALVQVAPHYLLLCVDCCCV